MHFRDQTIFALSSGRPPSAIAVVRLSGSEVNKAIKVLAGNVPAPRRATRALLRAADGQPIDDAVVLYFPGPRSATGEDVAEFQIHGGRAVLASLFAALSRIENIRAAEPGEFTRRAFENGKLDTKSLGQGSQMAMNKVAGVVGQSTTSVVGHDLHHLLQGGEDVGFEGSNTSYKGSLARFTLLAPRSRPIG
jgi:tRNA U34 5-carboxymethylaminomethyl modifying GTPase MnmE/TrmE